MNTFDHSDDGPITQRNAVTSAQGRVGHFSPPLSTPKGGCGGGGRGDTRHNAEVLEWKVGRGANSEVVHVGRARSRLKLVRAQSGAVQKCAPVTTS